MARFVLKTVIAYVDGEYLCDVVNEALKHNKMVDEMKRIILDKYKGKDVVFRLEEK